MSEHPQKPDERPATPMMVTQDPPPRPRMVTARAVLLALILMPLNAHWVICMEVIRYSGHPTTISLFFNVVFLLTVLLLLNGLLKRLAPRHALAPGELLTIYIMLALGSAIAGHDMIEVLTPILSHAHYFARPENGWANDILPYLPPWLTVSDPRALREFYTGTGSFYQPHNLRAWGIPVLWWTLFFVLLGFIMLCINTLLRRQWTESERLSYPLVTLPLEMVNPRTQLFRSRLFWAGFALAALLELWNGFAYLYPQIPSLPLKRSGAMQDLNNYITTPPWNAIGWTPVAVYPFGIALGMLLPVDLLFSAWFFAWVWRLERVFGAASGYAEIPGFPYVEEQSFGAYIGLAVFALWTSRGHFVRIWRGLWSRGVDLNDREEPLPYRWAAFGLLMASIALFAFCRACRMSPLWILACFTIYFALAIAITRMRAELGPPAHDLHRAGPDSILPAVFPSNQIPRADLAMFSLFYGFNRAYRSHPMPVQLEGFKIAERVGGNYRWLFWAMLLAIAWGALSAFWADLHQTYQVGAAEKVAPPNVQLIFGSEPWNRMATWVRSPNTPMQRNNITIAITTGFFLTLLLNSLRVRLSWFPFHPVGYAVSSSWSLSLLWLPLFIAWVVKALILRYGGLRTYRQTLPFFLGVILGECVLGSLWMLIGIVLRIPTYAFWP
ncbi:MAG: DUF6785 family protein [Chloroherpetonaceae bacterium]|nr:hypothetical protein [Chthonomonadaceae bacterium]MDW8208002.1 DUF6785 family protein [Chloroherpetonaceae bacterium]